jgi:ubiquinone/menaquinone biosynthesis C-methylase UbiE
VALRQASMQNHLHEMDIFAASLRGSKVIDAGCGGGRDTYNLLRAQLNVIGVDFAPKIIEQAKKSYPDAEDHFMEMDVTNLTFPGESYDGIWCRAVLLHLPPDNARQALNSFYRVLKPDGQLFLRTMNTRRREQYEAKERFNIEEDNIVEFRYFKTYEASEVEEMLRTAGFASVNAKVVPDEMGKPITWLNIMAQK